MAIYLRLRQFLKLLNIIYYNKHFMYTIISDFEYSSNNKKHAQYLPSGNNLIQ